MFTINENYLKLPGSYLFSTIAKKVSAYQEENPEVEIIRLGIGDVTQPLCPAVIGALHRAVDEMGQQETFRGYGPENGYAFLREAYSGDFRPFQHGGGLRSGLPGLSRYERHGRQNRGVQSGEGRV